MVHIRFVFFFLLLSLGAVYAQQDSTYTISKTLVITKLTFEIDSLTALAGSIQLAENGKQIDTSLFTFSPFTNALQVDSSLLGKQLNITYTRLNLRIHGLHFLRDTAIIIPEQVAILDPFKSTSPASLAYYEAAGKQLNKQGVISRGVSFGNAQDLSVNSALNLQLSGPIGENLTIAAVITDQNLPIQPEGNTQTLQDFDQVYIQLYNKNHKLTAGDFQLYASGSYFLTYNKRAQGLNYENKVPFTTKKGVEKQSITEISTAVSRGKFSRNIIQGLEGNQGPYRLNGADNELFITVLAGTERVYIDGKLLQRGQENDYVINYNTAELTFTANLLITKDKRIIVEFQYADKNYARSLLRVKEVIQDSLGATFIQAYSEQDAKNQPLQQTLNDERKIILQQAGDDLAKAIASGAIPTDFVADVVLYGLKDTTLFTGQYFDSIYFFTQDDSLAKYQVSFTNVGVGNGDYIYKNTENGKVYEWIAPDSTGIQYGDYAPIVQLIPPQKSQMIVVGRSQKMKTGAKLYAEAAITNYDKNTFSNLDNADNTGMAFKATYDGKVKQFDAQRSLFLQADYEFTNRNFAPIERFRSVEFDRDWNLRNLKFSSDLQIAGATFGYKGKGGKKIQVGYKGLFAGKVYTGNQASFGLLWGTKNGDKINYAATYTAYSGQLEQGKYVRHKTAAEKSVWKVTLGFRDDLEQNEKRTPTGDTLKAASYGFYEWESYLAFGDTNAFSSKIFYINRTDRGVVNEGLSRATTGQSIGMKSRLTSGRGNTFYLTTTYRKLAIDRPEITTNLPEENVTGRFEYNVVLLHGFVRSNAFFEIGAGRENKKEYTFLLAQGQGNYVHIDYNDNGIKELNEFEIAVPPLIGNYIKVYTPTNDYVAVTIRQFSQSVFLMPDALFKEKRKLNTFLKRWMDQFAARVDQKFVNSGNPEDLFSVALADTLILTQTTTLRNSLFFNRLDKIWGCDYTVQQAKSANLLTNGIESRNNQFSEVKVRVNPKANFQVAVVGKQGTRTNDAGAFITRNFNINYREIEPRINISNGAKLQGSIYFNYNEQRNTTKEFPVAAFTRKTGASIAFNQASKGTIQFTTDYYFISFNGPTNNSIAFDMLNTLLPGHNVRSSLSVQRNINDFLQLSLEYTLQVSESGRPLQTGGVQLKALF